ncbi:hypothetical protein [Streptomyces arboris]|uniref:hypothetical protein n=1 Tax=Streptomyces arboris TaxID=2600619 RepID=UPI00178C22A4|nr:hypothetical protein [Streptomyces arboris]
MASVMGLLEERETAARVRVEELRAEADRVLAGLGEAEAVLERRVIARGELAEALAAPGMVIEEPVVDPRDTTSKAPEAKGGAPVAGSIVLRRREGVTAEALAPDYRRIVELLEAELPVHGAGVDGEGVDGPARAGVGAGEDRGGAVEGEAAGRAGLADPRAVGPVHAASVCS